MQDRLQDGQGGERQNAASGSGANSLAGKGNRAAQIYSGVQRAPNSHGAPGAPVVQRSALPGAGAQGQNSNASSAGLSLALLGQNLACWVEPVPMRITAARLNVRRSPSSSGNNVLGSLARGTKVLAMGREGDWFLIDFNGQNAYIHAGYTEPVEALPAQPDVAPAAGNAGDSSTSSAAAEHGVAPDDSNGDGWNWMRLLWPARDTPASEVATASAGTSGTGAGAAAAVVLPRPPQPQDNAKAGGAAAKPPEPMVVPSGAADLRDKALAAEIAALDNPVANAAAHELAAVEKKYLELQANLANTEEKGKGRDELVAAIGRVRGKIAALGSAGLDAETAASLKARLYRAVQDVTPFYVQDRNIDLLEGEEQAKKLGTGTSLSTRTCNITSLSMALESLGKSASDYDASKRSAVLQVATVFAPAVATARLTVAGGSESWDQMAGLRLSDFMELAAIAEILGNGQASEEQVTAAAVQAWGKILEIYFLKKLAQRFGVGGKVKSFTLDPSKSPKEQSKDAYALKSWGKKHVKNVEALVDARNTAEASGSDKDTKAYEKQREKLDGAMTGEGIEDRFPLESYKDAIQTQIGAELDSGAAVVVALAGHYVRLQAIHDDHIVVDDPGRHGRVNRKVTYAEARAMGYFTHRLVLG